MKRACKVLALALFLAAYALGIAYFVHTTAAQIGMVKGVSTTLQAFSAICRQGGIVWVERDGTTYVCREAITL